MGFAVFMAGFAGYLVSLQFTAGVSVSGRIWAGVLSLVGLLMAAAFVLFAVQRFQVGIDQDGWTVRIGWYRHDVLWAEISAVVIANRETGGRGQRIGVYLVPEPGVDLDAPNDMRDTVDGRPAVRLFDLDEPKIEEKRFVSDLASLAGDRLDVRVDRLRLVRPSEGRPDVLAAFPPGVEGLRTQRWLNRRRFLLFAGWYLFAVVPALLLTGFAAGAHELIGAAAAIVGLVAVVAAYTRFVTLFSHVTVLVEDDLTIDGTQLVRVIGERVHREDLHSGRAVVLAPGARRGYGQAWLLGVPHAVALLGDPRTGRLREHDDLRALSAVLRESPHEADRAAARDVDGLVVRSQVGDPMEAEAARGADLWIALTKAGRVLAWAVVVGSVLLAGGWILESTRYLGGAVIFLGVALAAVWAVYTLIRISALVGAAWRAVRRSH